MTILDSMQDLEHCAAEPPAHVVRISFNQAAKALCYELPELPPGGLCSSRLSTLIQEFEYALNKRQRAAGSLYADLRERKVHVTWLTAHADALEREARMSRLFAERINGGQAA